MMKKFFFHASRCMRNRHSFMIVGLKRGGVMIVGLTETPMEKAMGPSFEEAMRPHLKKRWGEH